MWGKKGKELDTVIKEYFEKLAVIIKYKSQFLIKVL